MNWLDPIQGLYNMYLEEEETLQIVEVVMGLIDLDLDLEGGLADYNIDKIRWDDGRDQVTRSYDRSQGNHRNVMNWLDPIEELYDMYSEEEDTPRIVELGDDV